MRRATPAFSCLFLGSLLLTTACSGDDPPQEASSCVDALALGSETGHPDVFGAKAAGEARAARLTSGTDVMPPAHGRQGIEDGDFLLINDKIAVVIEDKGISDGYSRFGGEIIAIDRVGDDGKPLGVSKYLETLVALGVSMPKPTSVTVLADGADGGAAIVRVIGQTTNIPFAKGPLTNLFRDDLDVEVAYDYVLEPGAEHLVLRISVVNASPEVLDLGGIKAGSDEIFAFFQTNQSQMVTPENGFTTEKLHAWVGFVSGPWGFAWRSLEGDLEFGLEQAGFRLFAGPGFSADGCTITTSDRSQIIAGGPHLDGLREAVRRVDGEAPWRSISGTVRDSSGAPVAGAFIHELDEDDLYLSRTLSDESGNFTLHAPNGASVRLVAQSKGYQHDGIDVGATTNTADIAFEPTAQLNVTAVAAADQTKLPVRIQVIPETPVPVTPESFGILDEVGGRLHQHFAMTGEATLTVPPGKHRVIVSRGYEWELFDQVVTVTAGQTLDVDATLEHSVDSSGVMCADFHIHSHLSVDSTDPVALKVKSAVADGLDILVSSDHDWVVDFAPTVKNLSLEKWAFGMPSSELTTFQYGHFGVVPILPKPGQYGNGAIDWIDRTPMEVLEAIDALPEKPAVIVNHPSGGDFKSFFSMSGLDKKTGLADNSDIWSENFDVVEVFNGSDFDANREDSVAHWFALLNRGMRVFAVGNSDSHLVRSEPVGYPRNCYNFGHDDPQKLDASGVRDALLAGNSTVSGGLLMSVLGPGGAGPGSEVAASGDKLSFSVTVDSPSWADTTDIEVFVSGELVATVQPTPTGTGTSKRYLNQIEVPATSGDWVVFHARGAGALAPLHPGRKPFAVSNPIFVK